VTELTPEEIRVLGCLIEKQHTTPDAYPLSVNALRLACNQSTNRDPVVDFAETVVREAAQRLGRRGWARFTSGAGSRTAKYRHALDQALGLPDDEVVILATLMLRGAQTPGELKGRSDRMHPFADLAAVDDTLERLIARELAARLPRRPGQKEERYAHALGENAPVAAEPGLHTDHHARDPGAVPPSLAGEPDAAPPARAEGEDHGARIDRLEGEVASLREALEALRADLGAA